MTKALEDGLAPQLSKNIQSIPSRDPGSLEKYTVFAAAYRYAVNTHKSPAFLGFPLNINLL